MNTETILRLLTNSGFRVLGTDSSYVHIEDPACVLRSFETFTEYAWIIISIVTAILLTGWAISMIRGAKNDITTNVRNLLIMFATLAAAKPIVNVIWGDDLFTRGCAQAKIPIADIQKILDARNMRMSNYNNDLYEEFDIYDSGATDYDPATAASTDTTAPDVTIPEPATAPAASIPPTASVDAPAPTPVASPAPTDTPVNEAQPSGAAGIPISAAGAAADVIYTHADGTKIKRTGGSRAWRNTNPGNIRYSDLARSMGAIGQAGGFAVFPTEQNGMNAIKALLRSKNYVNLTVEAAIGRYAPPVENNTAAYNRKIRKLTGLDLNRKISDLSDAELDRMANAIRVIEGWTPGRTVKA